MSETIEKENNNNNDKMISRSAYRVAYCGGMFSRGDATRQVSRVGGIDQGTKQELTCVESPRVTPLPFRCCISEEEKVSLRGTKRRKKSKTSSSRRLVTSFLESLPESISAQRSRSTPFSRVSCSRNRDTTARGFVADCRLARCFAAIYFV